MKKFLGIVVLGLLLSGNGYADVTATAKHKDGSETFTSMPYSSKSFAEAIALAKCRTSELGKNYPEGCYVLNSKSNLSSSSTTNKTVTVLKKEKTLSKIQQIEIDQIKEMFDIGALTKEEYDNAIRRVLN